MSTIKQKGASGLTNLHIIDHPLIQHKLSIMREKTTPKMLFKGLLKEIALLMGYEITRNLPLKNTNVQTPLITVMAPIIAQEIAIIAVLRAGLGMTDGLLTLAPDALEGHIGLYRDPDTKEAVRYMVKLPAPEGRLFILVDPMLATGNSAVAAAQILKDHGVGGQNIRFLCLVAAPEGAARFHESHPEIPVYAAALDERLDQNAYIIPGLGDAGDRMFGTH